MDPIDELPGLSEVKMDTIDELPESSEVKMDTIDELPESSEEKVNTADELPNSSSLHDDRNDAELPPDYYDFPVKRMVYGDLTFQVLNGIVRIKGNNVCLRIIFAKPPRGIKPDRRHCLQIQLSFSHIHKFMFLAPENNNGATAIILAVSDVAVLRINGALSAATGDKVTGHPSRRYIFFDLLFNRNNPADSFRWDEILKYISHEYNMLIHKRLSEAKMVLSDKDYVELEKNLKAGNIGFFYKKRINGGIVKVF
uniref:Uncharacterized protein n=1 Tax=Panagrolaimus davidi TaxID=227884 RepID=A0A914PLB5_9BILA